MGRTPGIKNQPGHRAGGRREGAGRKRKAASDDDQAEQVHQGPHDDMYSNGAHNQGTSGSLDPSSSPSIKLSSIHPDLLPFLAVPHNIPLVCFFDPNRYNPAAQLPPMGQIPTSALSLLEAPGIPAPSNGNTGAEVGSSNLTPPADNGEGDQSPLSAQEGAPSSPTQFESTESTVSSSTGPYSFHNPNINMDPTNRRRRRCLICMNAGRVNHAFICPGRGNRAVCATAREIAKHGGTLPPESKKWNSKNTHTPVFTPVPTPVFPLIPAQPLSAQETAPLPSPPVPLPPVHVQAAGTAALITALSLPVEPPKPIAPLGYLTSGAIRKRRPRQCRSCVSRGEDGTKCIGRHGKERCPHYAEWLQASGSQTPNIADATSLRSDSDEEEREVSTLVIE